MYFLGIDLGSSSIKLAVLDGNTGKGIAHVTVPDHEMQMHAAQAGWAEQDPESWWQYTCDGIKKLKANGLDVSRIKAIGISYQMHGLVLTTKDLEVLRPSIIWCDSRAAGVGREIYEQKGSAFFHSRILGSPGNFTASKLKWVQQHEPQLFEKAAYMMLPGDYLAAKFSGVAQTSKSGLSEAALWNFKKGTLATDVLEAMGLPESLIPEIVSNFGHQAQIAADIAADLGLSKDVKITYRAGDQPNNALSLNVNQPGEIATTAGTSAVIYSVTDQDSFDPENRVNTFLHVNNEEQQKRNGVLLCINGSGILYQWLRKTVSAGSKDLVSYEFLNEQASKVKAGSDGLRFYPFGNGVERIFNNKDATSGLQNLNFNRHENSHLVRAACEGIVFAMNYGFEIMQKIGAGGQRVKATHANLFLSPVFREIFVNTTQTTLELYETNGAEGAARGAAYGFGHYKTLNEANEGLSLISTQEPQKDQGKIYSDWYQIWKNNIKINE
ncbi:xylulokinase [Leeuwenhoekiella parthenopeia]|uniref:Carbohydrate kinase n=1 Tax=Leeuwenhoekiella parthenopeia TaxID=2890320 RepID=A0ABS8GUP5_9FLAO|nr:FGGY family carbohydrate kinase [Leeuwenhoekiella parthenopeia]MCC4213654.1 carbohydrate kinase [Leeuwenhoekiella parthenopeia]